MFIFSNFLEKKLQKLTTFVHQVDEIMHNKHG